LFHANLSLWFSTPTIRHLFFFSKSCNQGRKRKATKGMALRAINEKNREVNSVQHKQNSNEKDECKEKRENK